MPLTANQVRQQVEEAMVSRGGASLTISPRLVSHSLQTGYEGLDAVLDGGLPATGTTEIVGSRSSGRATIAMAYLAQRTREGHICAWIDASNTMTPHALIANRGDIKRVLWVQCTGGKELITEHLCVKKLKKPDRKIVSYARDKTIGTPGVKNRSLVEVREVQVSSDRQPKRRGDLVLKKGSIPMLRAAVPAVDPLESNRKSNKPWGKLEQAIKAVDLLVQGGGFGTIVMDMGDIRPEFTRKIPLATWFRWRTALERTRTGLLVLSQAGCAGSSAEMMLRVEAELPEAGTVMMGTSCRLEVLRRRLEEVAGRKKNTVRASAWHSRPVWVNYD